MVQTFIMHNTYRVVRRSLCMHNTITNQSILLEDVEFGLNYNYCFTNQYIVIAEDYTIWIGDILTGQCVRRCKRHDGMIHHICITPDEKYVISGAEDDTVRVWNISTGLCESILEGHTEKINSVMVNHQYIISGSHDCTVRVWDINTGHCVRVLTHDNVIWLLCATSDFEHIISMSDACIKIWNIHTGVCENILLLRFPYYQAECMFMTADDQFIITKEDNNNWSLLTGEANDNIANYADSRILLWSLLSR